MPKQTVGITVAADPDLEHSMRLMRVIRAIRAALAELYEIWTEPPRTPLPHEEWEERYGDRR